MRSRTRGYHRLRACVCVRARTQVCVTRVQYLTSRGPLATAVPEHMAAHEGTA